MNGRIVAVYGNLVIAETNGRVIQNSVGYCHRDDGAKLLSEVIRIRGRVADLQVFEETRGLKVGDPVNTILNTATKNHLIVLGVSHLNPIIKYFKGSKPLSVMKKCNSPMMIVK